VRVGVAVGGVEERGAANNGSIVETHTTDEREGETPWCCYREGGGELRGGLGEGEGEEAASCLFCSHHPGKAMPQASGTGKQKTAHSRLVARQH